MITHEIIGDDMQAVVITLAAGEEVRAEAGAMTYMVCSASALVSRCFASTLTTTR